MITQHKMDGIVTEIHRRYLTYGNGENKVPGIQFSPLEFTKLVQMFVPKNKASEVMLDLTQNTQSSSYKYLHDELETRCSLIMHSLTGYSFNRIYILNFHWVEDLPPGEL